MIWNICSGLNPIECKDMLNAANPFCSCVKLYWLILEMCTQFLLACILHYPIPPSSMTFSGWRHKRLTVILSARDRRLDQTHLIG